MVNRELVFEIIRVTEAAALAAAPWMGKGKEKTPIRQQLMR